MQPFGVSPQQIYEYSLQLGYKVFDIIRNELEGPQQFVDSISATGVYDYIWIPTGSDSRIEIVQLIRSIWVT
jgi:hypothetical protein